MAARFGRIDGYAEDRWSWPAWLSRRVAIFALVLAVVAVAAHWLRLLETLPFLWVLAVVLGLALLALLLAAAGFQRVWYFGDKGGADMTVAIIVACLLLAPFAAAGWQASMTPALTEISTDLDDPPQLTAAATFRTADMNLLLLPDAAAREAQLRAYPALTGRRYAAGYDQIVAAVETLVRQRGWEIVSPLPTGSEIEVTMEALARLPILALPHDVAVRITDEGNATYVDMRSASRFGPRDLGVNAGLITRFLTELDAQAAALAGAATQSEREDVLTPPLPETAPQPEQ